MRSILKGLGLLALSATLAACNGAPAEPTPEGDGTAVPGLTASCGAVALPVAATPMLPETPLDGEAQAALAHARDVVGAEAAFFDAYRWSMAQRSEAELVLFGRPSIEGDGPQYGAAVFALIDNQWVPRGWGQCNIEVAAPGFGTATWVLDQEPGPDSTELPIQINERECASGQRPIGRSVVPVVVADVDRVMIMVLVEPLRGDAACPSNPWHPIIVDLYEPLGDRILLDGSTIPPLLRPWPPTPSSLESFGATE